MPLFSKNPNEVQYQGGKKHFVDIIKNRSDNDTFIFKNPEEDFNNGSTLVVEPGEQAIFVNEGNIEQLFSSGTYTLNTQNYPFISRLRNALSGGISGFHCVVFFVRTATSREIRWGTETPIKVYDKALGDQFTGLGVETEVRARGSYRVKVQDAGLLLTQLLGANYELYEQESIRQFFRNQFLGHIVSTLTQQLSAFNGPLIQAPSHALEYAASLEQALAPILNEYGLQLLNFSVSGIDIVDNEERRQAMELVTKNREQYYGSMAAGAGAAAYAQGQQQAFETYGTNYQQAQVLHAVNQAAANPGSDSGAFVGAGMGLAMGAGIGAIVPGMLNDAITAAGITQSNSVSAVNADTNNAEKTAVDVSQKEQTAVSVEQTDSTSDIVQKLSTLQKLRDAELISDEEYQQKRQQILESL